MTEIQRVVDELRFLLQREVVEQTDELADLVREYSAHCHAANVRLRRGNECLKQGLRSEALHLAEAAPNLLDVVAILDFAELDQLLEVVSMYFLAPPEPLLLDVASALNEAYAQHEPLQKLLDSHRLLALGRSPLSQRITILRSLAQLDAESPHWEADVRDMERARLSEMDAESRTAAARGDVATLKLLWAETQDENWYETVPASLLKTIKSRSGQTVRGNARERMAELEPELYAAYSALDVVRARPLRDEWNQKQQTVQLAKNDPLREQVAPILDWLEDEDRKLETDQAYSKVVGAIERAMDNDELSLADLKRLGLSLDRLDRSLPASLEGRYRNRLITLDVKESRRRRFLVAAGLAAFVAVVGVFGGIVSISYEAEKTRTRIAAVDAFITDGSLDEARKLMEQQPTALTSESWLAAQKKLIDAEQSEKNRKAELKAEMETVAQSTEPPRIEAAFTRARGLAKTSDEKIELGKLQRTWQQQVNKSTAAREQEFRERLATASRSLQALDQAAGQKDSPNLDDLKVLLSTAEADTEQLRLSRGSVANELESQASLLDSRLEASRQTLAGLTRKQGLLDKLTDSTLLLGTAEGSSKAGVFEVTLREFATVLPHDPLAATLKVAAETSPIPSVLERHRLIDRWSSLRTINRKDVETRLRDIAAFFKEHPASPDRDVISRYQTWLDSIQRRFIDDGDPDNGAQRLMGTLFSRKLIGESHTLCDTEEHTYYLSESRNEPFGDVISFEYLYGFNGDKRRITLKKPNILKTQKTVAAPQQEIATKVQTTIRDVGMDDWQKYFREITTSLLKADKIDPFLRYLLVLKTLEYASLGDQFLDQELAPVLMMLNNNDLDRTVAWMDPLNKMADTARKQAQALLAKMPPLEPIFANAAKRQQQLERDLFARRFSIGWLEKTSRGGWICRTKWPPVSNHVLYVVSRPDAEGRREWLMLGHVQDPSLTIDSTVAQAVGEAGVVFASVAPSETKIELLP